MKVKVEIDELLLHGFEKASAAHVGKIVESELARLVARDSLNNGVRRQNRELGMVDGGTITLSQGRGDARSLGMGIAKSIYSSLGEAR
jgi:hypothetical protein